jgi:hypothetical protein
MLEHGIHRNSSENIPELPEYAQEQPMRRHSTLRLALLLSEIHCAISLRFLCGGGGGGVGLVRAFVSTETFPASD